MPGKWPQGQRGDKVLQDLDRVQLGSHRYRQRSAQHEHAEDETGLGHEGGRACAIAISRKAVCAESSQNTLSCRTTAASTPSVRVI
jgi:hypothetical protein